ncbi:MAG: CBS domain-containing protein [Candidatus Woesearchaeota archaeon]|jgi:predicted transcriptional regulator
MFPAITEIKRQRKRLEVNQKDLAFKSGVSQSLIAKIESGKVEPTYSNAVRIFQSLEELREKEEVKAKDVMHPKVTFVPFSELVSEIIKIMKQKSISQLPVMNKDKVCGLITETTILQHFSEHPENFSHTKVNEIMEDAPPIVSKETGLRMLLEFIKTNPVILVAEKGEVCGIISKVDLLGRI